MFRPFYIRSFSVSQNKLKLHTQSSNGNRILVSTLSIEIDKIYLIRYWREIFNIFEKRYLLQYINFNTYTTSIVNRLSLNQNLYHDTRSWNKQLSLRENQSASRKNGNNKLRKMRAIDLTSPFLDRINISIFR